MERWNNEQLAEKRSQLANGFPSNVVQELEELNKNFAELCEDWALKDEQEKEAKKSWFLHAQLNYFKLGKSYALHLLEINGEIMETSSDGINSVAQNSPELIPAAQPEIPKTVLAYRDYQRLVMPIIELGQLDVVNESTVNDVLGAVQEALQQAEHLNFGLQESENAIMAIVYTIRIK